MSKISSIGRIFGAITGGLFGGTKVPKIELPAAEIPAAPAPTAGVSDSQISVGQSDTLKKNQRVSQRAASRPSRKTVDPLGGLTYSSGINI